MNSNPAIGRYTRLSTAILVIFLLSIPLEGQLLQEKDSVQQIVISTGWANEAVSIGYVTAPSVLVLMFVSALVNEWNAGYVGIPASVMIFAAPPLIYAGGRSVNILDVISQPRARLGWTLYALSIIPTSLALYGFTTDWGSTIPLTITSGILGSASIIAMTTYAYSRAETARNMQNASTSWNIGISPMKGGAMATVIYRF
ncbi:MAG: hypothetical protein KAR19_17505 [Bacteroidales bacterium]|nr:hypothetical protein [Bacteroidales bacterium]